MASQSLLRTVAATFLVTSLGWGIAAYKYWPSGSAPGYLPATISGSAPVATTSGFAPPPSQTAVSRVPAALSITPATPTQTLIIPVQGVQPGQLTDTFTQARDGGVRVHDAIDIMAPRGTPVLAAGEGTVAKLYTSAAGGLTIYLRLDDRRFILYYAHLDSYAAGLAEGQHVAQGQIIGAVGITGNASPTAPHLHFAVQQTTEAAKWYEPSSAINPYPLLVRR